MAYTKTTWVDGQTPALNATNLNKIEQGIEDAHKMLEEPNYYTATDTASIITLPSSTVNGQVSVGLNGRTYTNLLGNDGDFKVDSNADGLADGWVGTASGTYSITNNIQSFIATATGGYIKRFTTNGYSGNDKIYLVAEVKADSSSVYLQLYDGVTVTPVYHSGSGNFEKLSLIKTLDSNPTECSPYIKDIRASGWTEIQVKKVMMINLTQLFGVGNEPTLAECDEMFSYVNGTKSVDNVRIKPVGKNLVRNGNGEEGVQYWTAGINSFSTGFNNGTITFDGTYFVITDSASQGNAFYQTIPVKRNTDYYLSFTGINAAIYVYGVDTKSLITTLSASGTFNTGENDKIDIAIYSSSAYTEVKCKEIQLEEGTTATTYEPYKESIRYITLPQGVDGLHSLPDGTEDKITDDGKLIKRINKIALDGSLNWSIVTDNTGYKKLRAVTSLSFTSNAKCIKYTSKDLSVNPGSESADVLYIGTGNQFDITVSDVDSGWGESYTPSSDDIKRYFNGWQYVDGITWNSVTGNGETADATTSLNSSPSDYIPYTLIYQLAVEETYDLNLTPLTAFANGTVYFEKAIPEVSFYDSVNGCQVSDTKYPISSIDFIHKINIEDGSYVALDVSQAVIAGDGLSFTHPDLADGDLVDWDYFYAEELATYPEVTYTVPTNLKSQVNSNTDAINQLSKNVQNLDDRVKAVDEKTYLHDTVTGTKYKWGVENGIIFIEEVG